jgi:hypothetical protein
LNVTALIRWAGATAGIAVTMWVLARAGASVSDVTSFASPAAHLLAIAVFATDMLCRGARMSLLGRALGLRIPVGRSIIAQLAGEGAAAVTPSRVGSDAGRIYSLRNSGVSISKGAAIAVAEMVAEVVTLVLVVAAVAWLLPATRGAIPAALVYTAVVLITTLGSVALSGTAGEQPPRWWKALRLSDERWRDLREIAGGFRAACAAWPRLSVRYIVPLILLSATHILARLAILPALLFDRMTYALLGPSVAWPLVILHAGAMVPIPAGGGMIELAFATALDSTLPGAMLGGALVWWRVYTFYLLAAAGSLVLALEIGAGRRTARTASPAA